MAGFGTAGSLLAGAAVAFVLVSAVVAFRGWPQVGDQSPPTAVVVASQPVQSSIRSVRLQGPGAGAGYVAGARPSGVTGRAPGGVPVARTTPAVKAVVSPRDLGTQSNKSAAIVAKTPATAPAAAHCGGNAVAAAGCQVNATTGQLAGSAQKLTTAVGGTVAAAGRTLGSTVSNLVGAVATKLGGVSQPLANNVAQAGDAAANTVSGATGTAGQLVDGTGRALSGILGGGHR